MMSIRELVDISRYFGSDPAYILEGGRNTSFKDDTHMLVKASGLNLGSGKIQGQSTLGER